MAQNQENLDENIIGDKLTFKQELFCQNYVKNEEIRGNGTLTYDLAYNFKLEEKDRSRLKDEEGREIANTSEYEKCYNSCSQMASRLLKNIKIQARMEELWQEMFVDTKIDTKHAKLIFTAKDEVSLNAIKEYNKLKNRIIEKVEHSGGFSLVGLSIQAKEEVEMKKQENPFVEGNLHK